MKISPMHKVPYTTLPAMPAATLHEKC